MKVQGLVKKLGLPHHLLHPFRFYMPILTSCESIVTENPEEHTSAIKGIDGLLGGRGVSRAVRRRCAVDDLAREKDGILVRL